MVDVMVLTKEEVIPALDDLILVFHLHFLTQIGPICMIFQII